MVDSKLINEHEETQTSIKRGDYTTRDFIAGTHMK